jgi:hypothetical protein
VRITVFSYGGQPCIPSAGKKLIDFFFRHRDLRMPCEDATWFHIELPYCLRLSDDAVCDDATRFGPRHGIEFTQSDKHVGTTHIHVDAFEFAILQVEEIAVAHSRLFAVALLKVHVELRGNRIVVDIRHMMKVFVNARFVGREECFEHSPNPCVAPFVIGKRGLDRKDRVGREAIEYWLHVVTINVGEVFVYDQIDKILSR